MMISTRGRYALRVMLDLAQNGEHGFIPMKDVAARQQLSLKYIERILPVLVKNNFIKGVHGKGGGYCLVRKPEEYRIGDILRLTEGDLAPIACLECGAEPCDRAGECLTLPMWSKFNDMVNDYFDNITLSDLLSKRVL